MRWIVLPACMLLVLAACSGPRPSQPDRSDEPEPPPVVERLADYEDFDPAPYPEAPPEAEVPVRHDVPERLMAGRAAAGTPTTARGYRVQVYLSLDKSEAVRVEEETRAWWRAQQGSAPAGVLPTPLPIYTIYSQPYYRVRIGNFTSRSAAERARNYLSSRFPEASIVPDLVTVTR